MLIVSFTISIVIGIIGSVIMALYANDPLDFNLEHLDEIFIQAIFIILAFFMITYISFYWYSRLYLLK